MEGIQYPLPRTVEDVFADFKGRRSGFIKALSINALDFYKKCDPEKDNVCLYGLPDGSWMVNLPVDELPPELPEPTLGINFARGGMPWKDWISLVAVHSDSWLVSIAYYFAARFGFGKNERKRLFDMINDLPTVFEVITSYTKQSKATKLPLPIREEDESGDEEEKDDDDDEQVSSCAACGQSNGEDEFWILCDTCEKWFHGRCVRITPAKAKLMKHYKCPSCINKKPRV